PLREPPSRLAEVDAIVINQGTTGATESSAPAAVGPADVLTRTLAPLGERCCSMSLVTEDIRALHEAGSRSGRPSSSPRPGETITAVAGIGNPARFFDTLRVLGYQVIEQPFPDHHEFQPADFQTLKGPIIMTEKDAVKCRRILPAETGQFWVLAVTAVLPDAFYQSVVRHLLGVEAPGMR